jgi:protoporphyrinogen oxidase
VTVYESSDGIGGLAGGFKMCDTPLEKAYHFIYKTDKHMFSLLKELELYHLLKFHKSSVSTYYGKHLYSMMNPMDLIMFKPLKLRNRIRAGLVVLYLKYLKNGEQLSNITALEWLEKYAGKEVTEVLWKPLLKGKFDKYYDKITMCWLWGRIKQRADSQDISIGGEALGYIEGGFQTIINTLISKIEHKAQLKMNTPVSCVYFNNKSKRIVLELEADNEKTEYDKVLLTVPSKIASKILAPYKNEAYFQKLRSIEYLDAVVLVFATEQNISKYYWHNINSKNSPFVVFVGLTNLIGNKNFNGENIYYIGDYVPRDHQYIGLSEDEMKEHWFNQLKLIFPKFDKQYITDSRLFKLKNAQHIVDVGFEEKIPDTKTPFNNIYLSNFSQIYPMDRGTNYAVRDGLKVARIMLESGD